MQQNYNKYQQYISYIKQVCLNRNNQFINKNMVVSLLIFYHIYKQLKIIIF